MKKQSKDTSIYWDISKVLSYNCLFNFVVGARGVGKTYAFKKRAISRFLKLGEQFIYIRRYKTELEKIDKFFDDIMEEFPSVSFEVKGYNFYINGMEAGCAIPLSVGVNEKSVPYPNVGIIGFDEFLIIKGSHHYLKDEVTVLLELYETISRMRDVPLFMLSNALSASNPYFTYFKISLPYNKDIKVQGDILIQIASNDAFIEAKSKTRFGQIVAGTRYGDYAIENKFLLDSPEFIQKKYGNCEYFCTLYYMDTPLAIYANWREGLLFMSGDVDKTCTRAYSLTTSDHKPNLMLVKGKKSRNLQLIIDAYKDGYLRFENQNIKNIGMEVIELCL